ncbi:MAG: hypothetical protein ACK4OG_04885, partial [Parvibaculum sp.]
TLSATKQGPFMGPFLVTDERAERTQVRQNAKGVLGRAARPLDLKAGRPKTKTGPGLFSPIPPSADHAIAILLRLQFKSIH